MTSTTSDLTRDLIVAMEVGPTLDAMVNGLQSSWELRWETDKTGINWLIMKFPRLRLSNVPPLVTRRIKLLTTLEAKATNSQA